jgi:hypothetical protein
MTLYSKSGRPATEAEILAAAGAITSARRKTRGGGRPKELRKCPLCKAKLGAREMAAHKCPAK